MKVYLVTAYNSEQMDFWVHEIYDNGEAAVAEKLRMNDLMMKSEEETWTSYYVSARELKSN